MFTSLLDWQVSRSVKCVWKPGSQGLFENMAQKLEQEEEIEKLYDDMDAIEEYSRKNSNY